MQIVKTKEELIAAVGSNTAGYVALNKKITGEELHEGHKYLVDYCKANYDLAIVGFWDVGEFMNYLFPENPSTWFSITVFNWDSTGCIEWCVTNNVDIAFVPKQRYVETFFEGNDMETIVAFVEQKWIDEGYPRIDNKKDNESEFNMMRIAQGMCIGDYVWPDKPWVQVNTWKDGWIRFAAKDFAQKYATPLVYEIIDPVTCPEDGLYWSSAHKYYTQEQKDNIKLIPGIVDTTGYSDVQLLMDEINKIDPGNLISYRIQVTEGGVVGASNDFISVYFKYNNLMDVYPFFKKGVR